MELRKTENYKNVYLTAGMSPDRTAIMGCKDDFIEYAQTNLERNHGHATACILELDQDDQEILEDFYSECDKANQKYFVARDYLWTKIASTITAKKNIHAPHLEECAHAFQSCNMQEYIHVFEQIPHTDEVNEMIRHGDTPVELDVFMFGINDPYLQMSINNLLYDHSTSFYLKVFSDQKYFCHYETSRRTKLQMIHGLMPTVSTHDHYEPEEEQDELGG